MYPQSHTILITGGTSRLGYQYALQLAREQLKNLILIAFRPDADSAATSINRALGQNNVEYLQLDLSNLVEALILNAGLRFPYEVSYNDAGIEKTLAINHLGHCLLFYLLSLYLTGTARIVITASGTHDSAQKTTMPDAKYNTAEELEHPTPESTNNNNGRQRYSTSKLYNVLWMYALQKRIEASGRRWTVTAFDPGLMPGTASAREAPGFVRWIWTQVLPQLIGLLRRLVSPNIHTAQESELALLRLAVGKDVEGVSGAYFEGMEKIGSSLDSHNVEKQDDLWEWTAKHLAKDEVELQKFETLKLI